MTTHSPRWWCCAALNRQTGSIVHFQLSQGVFLQRKKKNKTKKGKQKQNGCLTTCLTANLQQFSLLTPLVISVKYRLGTAPNACISLHVRSRPFLCEWQRHAFLPPSFRRFAHVAIFFLLLTEDAWHDLWPEQIIPQYRAIIEQQGRLCVWEVSRWFKWYTFMIYKESSWRENCLL